MRELAKTGEGCFRVPAYQIPSACGDWAIIIDG